MFNTVPAALNPNVTASITYNKSAPLAAAVDAQVSRLSPFSAHMSVLSPVSRLPSTPRSLPARRPCSIHRCVRARNSHPNVAQEYVDVNDTALVPFVAEPQLPPPDRVIDLNAFFATMDNGVNR